jgi:hypothetical protein
MPPQSSPWKIFLRVGLVSLIGYIAVFSWMENNRRKDGPWEITFTQVDNSPVLLVNHAKLGLTNVTIVFPAAVATTNAAQTIRFEHGRVAPFDLPFGKCVFLDTLYLPGTVTMETFGHLIQVLPRTMTIDRVERPWSSGEKILLTNRPPATLPPN